MCQAGCCQPLAPQKAINQDHYRQLLGVTLLGEAGLPQRPSTAFEVSPVVLCMRKEEEGALEEESGVEGGSRTQRDSLTPTHLTPGRSPGGGQTEGVRPPQPPQ